MRSPDIVVTRSVMVRQRIRHANWSLPNLASRGCALIVFCQLALTLWLGRARGWVVWTPETLLTSLIKPRLTKYFSDAWMITGRHWVWCGVRPDQARHQGAGPCHGGHERHPPGGSQVRIRMSLISTTLGSSWRIKIKILSWIKNWTNHSPALTVRRLLWPLAEIHNWLLPITLPWLSSC